CLQSKISPWTF
nr:immunoglobulin light chain junction region [Macaca mulatta]